MELETLLQRPESQRDNQWEQDFLTQFSGTNVHVDGDQAKVGPDGWPYLFVRTGADATEPAHKVVQWLAGRGIGLAVNAHKMIPDYIFPYGMLWNFVETGRFLHPEPKTRTAGEVSYTNGVITGPPSEKYLPPYVRDTIREFLRAQGFTTPRVLVVSSKDFDEVDLVLSVNSLAGLERKEHQAFADRVAWFLPLHYTLVLGDEAGLPPFSPL